MVARRDFLKTLASLVGAGAAVSLPAVAKNLEPGQARIGRAEAALPAPQLYDVRRTGRWSNIKMLADLGEVPYLQPAGSMNWPIRPHHPAFALEALFLKLSGSGMRDLIASVQFDCWELVRGPIAVLQFVSACDIGIKCSSDLVPLSFGTQDDN